MDTQARKARRTVLRERSQEAEQLVKSLLGEGRTIEGIAAVSRVSTRTVYRWLREGRSPHPVMLDQLRQMRGSAQGAEHGEHRESAVEREGRG